jgi:hypothetical protein
MPFEVEVVADDELHQRVFLSFQVDQPAQLFDSSIGFLCPAVELILKLSQVDNLLNDAAIQW